MGRERTRTHVPAILNAVGKADGPSLQTDNAATPQRDAALYIELFQRVSSGMQIWEGYSGALWIWLWDTTEPVSFAGRSAVP